LLKNSASALTNTKKETIIKNVDIDVTAAIGGTVTKQEELL